MNQSPTRNGLTIAEAITKIFAKQGITPRVVVDPSKGPHWNPATNTVSLPALPTHDLTEEEQAQLRAYFWHESQGELGNNSWHNDRRLTTKQRKRLSNGIGDGFLDKLILADRPGAGADIRQQVAADAADLMSNGAKVTPSVGVASAVSRYIVEGVTTWAELRSTLTNCGELFDHMQPVLPDGVVLADAEAVVTKTLEMDAALERYKNGDESPDSDDDSGEGNGEAGNEQKDGKPKQGKPKKDKPKQDKQRKEKGEDSGDEDGEAEDGDFDGGDSSEADGDGDSDGEADSGDADGSDGDDASGEPTGSSSGSRDVDDDDSEADGNPSSGSFGNTEVSNARKTPRNLTEDGDDSEDRINKKLADMLTGKGGNGSGKQQANRLFNEELRTVVSGEQIDAYMKRLNTATNYAPSASAKADASVLVNRLRAALVGPSMKVERNQEYGRFDARRAASAMAGSRTVYNRRREIQGEDVAVSIAWDESGSMGGDPISKVAAAVERFALALKQMPNVTAEFIGWTDGIGATEGTMHKLNSPEGTRLYNLASDETTHNAGDTAVHRIYKSFDESPEKLGPRLKMIAARSGTPMTEGFAFSAKRLAARKEKRKVLFFLTDGQASSHDTSDEMEWGYNALAYETTRAAASGIDVIVFNIGKSHWLEMLTRYRDGTYTHMSKHALNAAIAQCENAIKQETENWGPAVKIQQLPVDDTFMQTLFNSLTSLLTHKTRASA